MSTDLRDLLREGPAEPAGQTGVPTGLGIRAYGRWRRRRAWHRALFGGATGGLAVVIVLAATTGSEPFGSAAPRPAAAPHMHLPAGAADSAKLVEYTRTALPPGSGAELGAPSQPSWLPNTRYTKPVIVQRNYRNLSVSTFYPRPGVKMFTQSRTAKNVIGVTFSSHTWWRYGALNSVGLGNQGPWCTSAIYLDNWNAPITGWARVLASLLACHYVQVNPSAQTDGHPAIELSQRATRADTGIWWHLWVNPTTYLPIRLATIYYVGIPTGHFASGVTTFQWLHPTRANLAPFRQRVPPGYKRVSPPHG